LGLIRDNWIEALDHPRVQHVPWAMVGCFKTKTGEKVFYQPLAVVTKSGIEIEVWIKRTIDAYAKLGITSGPFFWVNKKGGGFSGASLATWTQTFTPSFSGSKQGTHISFHPR
jgi:hypothetical protein